jgi:hypothetical protein
LEKASSNTVVKMEAIRTLARRKKLAEHAEILVPLMAEPTLRQPIPTLGTTSAYPCIIAL